MDNACSCIQSVAQSHVDKLFMKLTEPDQEIPRGGGGAKNISVAGDLRANNTENQT